MIILEIPGEEFFVESSKNLKEAEKFLDKYKNQKGLRILMSVSHGQGVRFVPVTSILKSRTAEQICLAADNIEIFNDEPFDSLVYKNGPVNKEYPTQLIPVM